VVVETRPAVYPVRGEAYEFRRDGRLKRADDPGGVGREIVREIVACDACAEAMAERAEETRAPPRGSGK
jgi:hypothetical protein